MTATTEDIQTPYRERGLRSFPVGAGVTLYAGAMACRNASGYAVDANAGAGLKLIGVVDEAVDNSAGLNDDLDVDVREEADFLFEVEGGTSQADVGKDVYVKDNQTVAFLDAVTNPVYVGVIVNVESATLAWIRIRALDSTPDAARTDEVYQVQIAGTDTAAFDLSAAAALYGGDDFFVVEVLSAISFVFATGALDKLKALTTDYTVAAGAVTTTADETANTWVLTFRGRLVSN